MQYEQQSIRVSHDAGDGGGDDDIDDEGGGGRGAHTGAASPEQFRILSDTFSNIQRNSYPWISRVIKEARRSGTSTFMQT